MRVDRDCADIERKRVAATKKRRGGGRKTWPEISPGEGGNDGSPSKDNWEAGGGSGFAPGGGHVCVLRTRKQKCLSRR